MSAPIVTDRTITDEVAATLGEHLADFDVAAIVSEITATYGLVSIKVIDNETYWEICRRHDVSA